MGTPLQDIMQADDDARNQLRLGGALLKATQDPFSYCARLRSGELVFFESAFYDGGDWIHLELDEEYGGPNESGVYTHGLPVLADRGIEVRLSDIVWAADAPRGT
jgi:hypothetical protein